MRHTTSKTKKYLTSLSSIAYINMFDPLHRKYRRIWLVCNIDFEATNVRTHFPSLETSIKHIFLISQSCIVKIITFSQMEATMKIEIPN